MLPLYQLPQGIGKPVLPDPPLCAKVCLTDVVMKGLLELSSTTWLPNLSSISAASSCWMPRSFSLSMLNRNSGGKPCGLCQILCHATLCRFAAASIWYWQGYISTPFWCVYPFDTKTLYVHLCTRSTIHWFWDLFQGRSQSVTRCCSMCCFQRAPEHGNSLSYQCLELHWSFPVAPLRFPSWPSPLPAPKSCQPTIYHWLANVLIQWSDHWPQTIPFIT